MKSAERDTIKLSAKALLDVLMVGIPERNRYVIEARFGLAGQRLTLEELGRELGVTRERVRQLQSKTLCMLRHRAAGLEATHKLLYALLGMPDDIETFIVSGACDSMDRENHEFEYLLKCFEDVESRRDELLSFEHVQVFQRRSRGVDGHGRISALVNLSAMRARINGLELDYRRMSLDVSKMELVRMTGLQPSQVGDTLNGVRPFPGPIAKISAALDAIETERGDAE